jgi:hypothetical protein
MTVSVPPDGRVAEAAKRLAALTGEEPEAAVATAVQERLAKLENSREARVERLVRLGLHCAENLTGPPLTSEDVDTWLYDPHTGLPR